MISITINEEFTDNVELADALTQIALQVEAGYTSGDDYDWEIHESEEPEYDEDDAEEWDCVNGNITTTVYTYKNWYVAHGGCIINHTMDKFYDGINLNNIYDHNSFTSNSPINSRFDLIKAVEE